ncbi:tryptophan-rich sensory protein [Pseudanabaena sp. UWO310]|uniref:tryptophan-rich sensory protein n=1 Tax=Pseudanabaena sp. UWO310 TaxID=2480795 RepID=UPI001CC20BEF|nr:tryptophan-rich sensory protein [Pseudanabaena sp. UWO310]
MASLSDELFTSVQILPANYAFAIWGLIYLSLIIFGIYQVQPSQRYNPRLQRSGYLLVFACIAQCTWIYLFLARLFPLSVIAMLGILVPLILMYQALHLDYHLISLKEEWFIRTPISIYLGWITAAFVVNVSVTLYSLNWNGWNIASPIWTVIMMTVATAITSFVIVKYQDTVYALVIIWTLVAIAIRQWHTPLVTGMAILMAIALVLLCLMGNRKLSSTVPKY